MNVGPYVLDGRTLSRILHPACRWCSVLLLTFLGSLDQLASLHGAIMCPILSSATFKCTGSLDADSGRVQVQAQAYGRHNDSERVHRAVPHRSGAACVHKPRNRHLPHRLLMHTLAVFHLLTATSETRSVGPPGSRPTTIGSGARHRSLDGHNAMIRRLRSSACGRSSPLSRYKVCMLVAQRPAPRSHRRREDQRDMEPPQEAVLREQVCGTLPYVRP
ncbi:hypothetical protein C8Q80DRAFT_642649 [Daedaleopsis nitida]|nr:hypothetical protein C8Q80DRAFT_642649 [Daedaleopsis nitida]